MSYFTWIVVLAARVAWGIDGEVMRPLEERSPRSMQQRALWRSIHLRSPIDFGADSLIDRTVIAAQSPPRQGLLLRSRPPAWKRPCLNCGFPLAVPLVVRICANAARLFVQRWHRPGQVNALRAPDLRSSM